MKPDERLKSALESIARREVPQTVNLWPQLAAHLAEKEIKTMKPALRMIWMALLVLLALALVSGVAYALYNYFRGDVGMEAASQAGLVSEANVTALPTPLPTPTPLPPAVSLGEAQTLHGVTLTLDWVYLDDLWQAIGFSVAGLAEDQRLGIPQLEFGEIQPEQYRGAGMALLPSEGGLKGRYVVHQLVRDQESYMVANTYTDVSVAIPLLDGNGNILDTFRFTAPHVLVHQAPYGGGNTYSVRSGGLEMRLEWVIATPQETRAKLCYQQSSTPTLKLKAFSALQSGQITPAVFDAPSISPQQVVEIAAAEGWRCVEAVFPPLAQDVQSVVVAVESLRDAEGKDMPGALEFVWSELPWRKTVPGIDPLPSQAIGEVKITLLQAYVDALRAVVVYRVEGFPTEQSYDLQLTDVDGKPFFSGSGSISTDENDPNVFVATFTFAKPHNHKADNDFFSPKDPISNGRFVGKLKIFLNPWDAQGGQVFTFDLDLPAYPALVLTPAQSVISEGLEMRLERLEITPSFTRAYLCYQKPSLADWMLAEKVTLRIGGAQAGISDYSLAFDEDYGTEERPEWATLTGKVRCVTVGFAVGHHGQPETLTLAVDELAQSVPEVIPDDQLQAAKEKLRQQGIEIDWVTFSGNDGGGGGPQIKQKPQGMTDTGVIRLFYEALGYYFPGSWTFTVEIQP